MKIYKQGFVIFVAIFSLMMLPVNSMAQDEKQEVEKAVEKVVEPAVDQAVEQIEEQIEEQAEERAEGLQPFLGTEVDEETIEQAVEEAAEEAVEEAVEEALEEGEDVQTILDTDVDQESVTAEIKAQMEKDQTGTNPLNFTYDARLYNEYMWLNTLGDGYQNITTFEFRAPLADGKWQFRGKIRGSILEADFNNDGIDDVDHSGFGDTDLRFMTIPYLKKFGFAWGVEFFLDTASHESLGTGANSIAPFVGLAFFNPFGPGSLFVPLYQHKISVNENTGRDRVHQGILDLFMVKTFQANKYWGYIDPQVILDYENNKEFMLLEIQLGMMTGPKGQSVWIMPSIGVGNDRPYDFSLEVGYKIVWR